MLVSSMHNTASDKLESGRSAREALLAKGLPVENVEVVLVLGIEFHTSCVPRWVRLLLRREIALIVAHKLPLLDASCQDNIAVRDTDTTICSVGLSLKTLWRTVL